MSTYQINNTGRVVEEKASSASAAEKREKELQDTVGGASPLVYCSLAFLFSSFIFQRKHRKQRLAPGQL